VLPAVAISTLFINLGYAPEQEYKNNEQKTPTRIHITK